MYTVCVCSNFATRSCANEIGMRSDKWLFRTSKLYDKRRAEKHVESVNDEMKAHTHTHTLRTITENRKKTEALDKNAKDK